jgi:hypothetical protein
VYRSGVTAIVSPSTRSSPSNVPHPCEARRVEQDAVAVAADVLRFGDRPVFRPVDDVEADALVVGVADQPQFAERFDHFDAVRADLLRLLVVGPGPRHADRPLAVAAPHGRVGVDHAEVRVHAETSDEVRVGFVVDALIDAPVVDVAVARRDVTHR